MGTVSYCSCSQFLFRRLFCSLCLLSSVFMIDKWYTCIPLLHSLFCIQFVTCFYQISSFRFNILFFLRSTGRSQHKDAEARSALVFDQAVRDGAKPNVITYSSLLSALSRSRWVSHWDHFQQWYSKKKRDKRQEKHWSIPIYFIIKINITLSDSIVLFVLRLLYCCQG